MSVGAPQHFKDFLRVLGREILERTIIYRSPESRKNEECGIDVGRIKVDSKYDLRQEMGVEIKTRYGECVMVTFRTAGIFLSCLNFR